MNTISDHKTKTLKMKKIIYAILLLPFMLCAQSGEQNYVKTKSYKEETLEPITSPTATQVKTDLVYFDGLGRPIQKNAHLQSSTGHDIITHMTYDALGRQSKEYLPFSSQQQNMAFDSDSENNTLNYQAYNGETNPYSQKFYDFSPLNKVLKQALPGNDWIGNENDDNDHAVKFVYDTNVEQEKVWNFYVLSGQLASNGYCKTGTLDKTIVKNENWTSGTINTTEEFKDYLGRIVLKRDYESKNEMLDTYYVYDASGNVAFVVPPLASPDIATVIESQIPYRYSQDINISGLLLNYTSGGGGFTIIIENNTIKVAFSAGFNATKIDTSKSFTINASRPVPDMTVGTLIGGLYTVYIQNNQLKFIDNYPNYGNITSLNQTITAPLDTSQFGTLPVYTTVVDQSIIPDLCYQYKYDARFRLIEKKLPGKQWEFIVYDKLDRIIATGPTLQPFGNGDEGWLFTKYDLFGRPAYSGWYNGHQANAAERNNLQILMNSATTLYESRASNTIDNVNIGYSNSIFPTASYYLLSANYYDTYDFPNVGSLPTSIFGIPVLANAKGLPTGSWTRVLTSAIEFAGDQSVIFYDAKDRPIRSYLKNYLGGYTQTDSRIDFSGKTLYTITEQRKGSSGTPIIIREDFSYTDQDRLLAHTHQINGGIVEVLAKNEYDEIGQLIRKNVGRTDGNPLQQVDYSYNIRGWLKEINQTEDLNMPGEIADLFAFKINYNSVENTLHNQIKPLYNGNIAETYWKTSSDGHLRGYGYTFDNLNRLNMAFYHKNGMSTGCYDESLSYDKNGNIESLLRFGNSDGQNLSLKIDELTYAYHPDKKNQLLKVFDNTNEPLGFDDDSDGITDIEDDYDYDANGNMTKDQNKGITSISYNHLNLPVSILFNNDLNTKIDYFYRADGSKIQKKVFSYNPPPGALLPISTVIEYMGGFQYRQDVLQFFPTAEGYVNHTSGSYSYVYHYTDHLGNIRLSYAQDPQHPGMLKTIEENHYYPFGMKHTNYNVDTFEFGKNNGNLQLRAPVGGLKALAYLYKYNGKEFQDELGLNMTAMDYRQYDSAIGRFVVTDPFAELSYSMTPYKFAYNNPVYWNDPLGLFETKDDAKKYAKEEGIRTGWFSSNKIEKDADGVWSINNGKEGTSISAANADTAEALGVNTGDIVTSAFVQSESKSSKSDSFGWFTVWGSDRSGDTSGLKGTTYESIESSKIPSFSGSRARDIKESGGILAWFKNLFTGAKDVTDLYGKSSTIQAINEKPNTSTMEVQNKEPVIVSSSIKVVSYTFHLNDSTVTKNSQNATFKGEASEVKKKIDSVQGRNESRASDKAAWLKSW